MRRPPHPNLTGRIVLDLEPAADRRPLEDRLRRVMGGGELFSGLQDPARDRRDPRGDRTRSGASTGLRLPYQDEACRQDVSFTSPEINANIGGGRPGADWRFGETLDDLEFTIHIEILSGEAFFYAERSLGAGGLPAGISGRPRSSFQAGSTPRRDVPDDAARLWRPSWSISRLIRSSPRRPNERRGAGRGPDPVPVSYAALPGSVRRHPVNRRDVRARSLRVVVYRRLMIRIAEEIAHKTHAKALVTGERSGRSPADALEPDDDRGGRHDADPPASQSGMDKREIADEAAESGHLRSRSSRPGLLYALHAETSATRTTVREIEAAETASTSPPSSARGVEGAEVVEIAFPDGSLRRDDRTPWRRNLCAHWRSEQTRTAEGGVSLLRIDDLQSGEVGPIESPVPE